MSASPERSWGTDRAGERFTSSTRTDFPIPDRFSGAFAFGFPPSTLRRRGILDVKSLRSVTLIISLAVVAIMLVYLRWEQTRIAAGLLRAETRWVELRREWWSLQASTARFRSPARMRGRADVIHEDPRLLVDSTAPTAEPFNDSWRHE